MTISKKDMLRTLPICELSFIIRRCKREDMNKLAQWPKYPWPYDHFTFSFASMTPPERKSLFESRQNQPTRIMLILDHAAQVCIGYLALVQIDWSKLIVGDMAVRIEPSWCNKGIGTLMIRTVSDWCFSCGLCALRLSVAATNAPAIRCYEKVGFTKKEEFWQQDDMLKNIDINQPRYNFLKPHIRFDQAVPQVRFWWMELSK